MPSNNMSDEQMFKTYFSTIDFCNQQKVKLMTSNLIKCPTITISTNDKLE